MTLDLSANEEYVGLPASVALAAAIFEQTGLRELIDSRFDLDPRQKLSPGNAIKALIGDMVGSRGRSALFNVSYKYMAAPNDLLFGRKVDVKAVGGRAFSRDLDKLYELDLPGLSYECYSKLASFYGLKSNVFNVDSTNFSITADGIAIRMSSLILKHDPATGTESFMGPREVADEYLDIVQALGLDMDRLIN